MASAKRHTDSGRTVHLCVASVAFVSMLIVVLSIKATYDAAVEAAVADIQPTYAATARIMQQRLDLVMCQNKEAEAQAGMQSVCAEAREFQSKHGDAEILRQARQRVNDDLVDVYFDKVRHVISAIVSLAFCVAAVLFILWMCVGSKPFLPA